MMESFLLRWGYLAIGAGTFFEGEAILIAGGALAHRGLLSLPLVMLAAFVGSVAGDQVWFQAGRRFGRPFIERRPRWKTRATRAEVWVARYGALFVFGFRFIYGIRTITPLFLGASAYSMKHFALLNVLGGAAWAVVFGGAGWALGASMETLLQRTTRLEELVGAVVVVAFGMWLVSRMVQRRRTARGGGDHGGP
jgi:membrane protein DedA with SNARE-associated domain